MIVTVDQIKEQLNITADLGTDDDALIGRKAAAAQDHIERLLGYKIEETYGGDDQDPIPPALVEAVCQLAGQWYENRELSATGIVSTIPFGLEEIVRNYRNWTF
jgi:uncharacterized phage protein (predicted DNA packaging)